MVNTASKGKWKSVYDTKEMVAWYKKRAEIIGLKRDELHSAIINMFPYGREESIRALELGAGTGDLTEKILQSFPSANLTCVDGSSTMLDAAKAMLRRYRERITFFQKDFGRAFWNKSLGKYHVVASARAIHHLPDERKKSLFREIYKMLETDGCFVNGDLIKSKYEILNRKYYDDIWASHIKKKTKEVLGIDRSMEEVRRKMREASEKEGDRPATVEDQLKWLLEAGFSAVDCAWKYFHIAVVVGLK